MRGTLSQWEIDELAGVSFDLWEVVCPFQVAEMGQIKKLKFFLTNRSPLSEVPEEGCSNPVYLSFRTLSVALLFGGLGD